MKIENGKFVANTVFCSRCGKGCVMADHRDCYYYRYRHYTQFENPAGEK
ncbi:30S ribosomal protein S27ae [Candidatus Bathyarchaeota archaeon]|nr:MAG: 30S ribosomal protein S27ae [Candidatus Bathyarchaeota archaeon]